MGEAAAVDPEEHGPAAAVGGGRVDVKVEAVFVLRAAGREAWQRVAALPGGVAPLLRVADAGPRCGRLGRAEAAFAAGGRGEGDAEEGEMAVAGEAVELAVGGFDDGHVEAPRRGSGGILRRWPRKKGRMGEGENGRSGGVAWPSSWPGVVPAHCAALRSGLGFGGGEPYLGSRIITVRSWGSGLR